MKNGINIFTLSYVFLSFHGVLTDILDQLIISQASGI